MMRLVTKMTILDYSLWLEVFVLDDVSNAMAHSVPYCGHWLPIA
jgi:hypothetical protein